HYTGYVFNDYARMLAILEWIATQMPAERVLVFISAWDGRYYWDYPTYRAAPRLGGEAGFRRLVQEGHRLGFRIMPMFGANAANRRLPNFTQLADAATARVDGDRFDLNWVDWDNDRHQEGFGVYMNLGVASWRRWLTARIADVIERYGVDASGFGRWDPATLSLSKRDGLIPTLMVVDDTFTGYREQMAAVIAQAKAWAGL